MRAEHPFRIGRGGERTGAVHTAQGAHALGEHQSLGDVLEVCLSLDQLRVQEIAPSPDFRKEDILGGECLLDRAYPLPVTRVRFGKNAAR